MPRLDDGPVASGTAPNLRSIRRSNGGSHHGKGKKRVSDEGMDEEEGLLSGLRTGGSAGEDVGEHEDVSCVVGPPGLRI